MQGESTRSRHELSSGVGPEAEHPLGDKLAILLLFRQGEKWID